MAKSTGGKPPTSDAERKRLEAEAARLAEKLKKDGKITDQKGRHKR